ncbi:UNVERIFIED_CONTAM: hypothetical protein PYX00_008234 [Menopon gallinae]|uniref:Sulfhydryl oxidase n=1 Tax=Menopon gallinae TaxID=328185 RepID=A0AAW2HMT2_9NEOP
MDAESTDPKKPCRACQDFKQWSRRKREEFTESETDPETAKQEHAVDHEGSPTNCPLDREGLGRSTWGFLHTMAAYYPDKPTEEQENEIRQFFNLFSHFYPCQDCAEDLQRQIQRFPPKTESRQELSQWLCRVHNRINLRLGKPQFDCTRVDERWKDGWSDGSCD